LINVGFEIDGEMLEVVHWAETHRSAAKNLSIINSSENRQQFRLFEVSAS